MEPFSLDEIIFYKREFKEMYNLSDAAVLDSFEDIRKAPRKVNAALVLCEFYEKTLPAEEMDGHAFSLLLSFLRKLRGADESIIRSMVMSNLIKAFSGAGVMPHLDDCVRCHATVGGNNRKIDFSVASGGVVCSKHHDDTVMLLSPQTIRTIKGIYTTGKALIDRDSMDEIENVITDYMYIHLGNLNLNSLKHLK
jgi:DNA repair protein RecO